MIIMNCNIGGAKAYPNIRNYILNIEHSVNIPDVLFVQEPGDPWNFDTSILEPFFTDFYDFGKIRLHHRKKFPINTPIGVNGIDGCSFTLDIEMNDVTHNTLVIGAYRRHSLHQHFFFNHLDHHITKYNGYNIVLSGDFNTHVDNKYLNKLITKFGLRSMSSATHQHRATDGKHQIDYVLTNLPNKIFGLDISYSLENKAIE